VPIRIVDTAGINRRATHVKGASQCAIECFEECSESLTLSHGWSQGWNDRRCCGPSNRSIAPTSSCS
jgi:hypothetical protein